MVQALSSTYSITFLLITSKLAGTLSENHDYMDPFKVAYYILVEVGQNYALVCLRKISFAYICRRLNLIMFLVRLIKTNNEMHKLKKIKSTKVQNPQHIPASVYQYTCVEIGHASYCSCTCKWVCVCTYNEKH